jgi:hypothetical protein
VTRRRAVVAVAPIVPAVDLFARARTIFEAVVARGVTFDERADDGLLTIDLRAFGAVEVFGTESAATFRFSGAGGDVRILLESNAFFTLRKTLEKGLT